LAIFWGCRKKNRPTHPGDEPRLTGWLAASPIRARQGSWCPIFVDAGKSSLVRIEAGRGLPWLGRLASSFSY
jgi:hypothetical protein